MRFSDLPKLCHGKILQEGARRPVETLVIDSRKAVISEGSVFLAIQGDRHDGHLFLKELYEEGLRQFIVEVEMPVALFPGANILKVESAVAALQAIAAHHRRQFEIPVIGITGSNGKTIIKEWLSQVLSPNLHVVKNPGSYNSQVGVPLSVWQMESRHDIGIFEAGISKPEEMANLESVIHPTIGIFTNLGGAHDEGFSSRKQKAEEKAILFRRCERVICCSDHSIIPEVLAERQIPTLTWGLHSNADISIRDSGAGRFDVTYHSESFSLQLPFQDAASRENAFHVVAFMLLRGYKPAIINERIHMLRSVPMRLELKQGINRCTIIDDSYNNDLAGLKISLDFLKNQQKTKKTVILSDILQSGLSGAELSSRVKELFSASQAKRIIGIGPDFLAAQGQFPGGRFYPSTEDFLREFKTDDFTDEVVLVKGARTFHFERIVQRLQRKVHGTVMEIDLNAMAHNLNYFKSRLSPGTRIMAMVKAFAYGSGSEEVSNLLQYHRAEYLGVAYADEGIELRKNNISLPIMVMNPSEESFDLLLEYRLEPEMYNKRVLLAFLDFLKGRPCTIHIKIDTGMHRLGFEEEEIEALCGILESNRNVHVASVFSHLSGADEKMHDDFSQEQAAAFVRMAERLEKVLGYRPLRHLLNSPGILRLPQYQFDMVRLGIGLYGVDPTEAGSSHLKPVATLKTIISQIKKIKAGQTIGYGRKGKAEHDMVLATLAIGYADGYNRSFSRGKGKALIGGQLAPVMGNVCMDMTMVDITGIKASEGDEAIIFGPGLPIQQVAKWIDTIPYEILTNTSERVKRVFFAESI